MPIDPWPVHAKLATTTPPITVAIIQRSFAGGQIRAATNNKPSSAARTQAIAPNRVDISTAPHDVHVPVRDSASAISYPNVATMPTARATSNTDRGHVQGGSRTPIAPTSLP